MSMECDKKTAPIGVFDSGVGGLTVVREITRQLPHENILYFGDTARVPVCRSNIVTLFFIEDQPFDQNVQFWGCWGFTFLFDKTEFDIPDGDPYQ